MSTNARWRIARAGSHLATTATAARRGWPGDEGYLSKRDEYCPLTNLFHDGTAAAAWADENGIRGTVLAVQQASIDAALDWRPLVVDRLLHP